MTAADQTDEEIEAIVAGLSSEQRARLHACLTDLRAVDSPIAWAGPERVDTDDASEPAVWTFTNPSYPKSVDGAVHLLYELGLIVPFDWMDWDGAERFERPEQVDAASVADAVRLVTGIVRSDRFGEGCIAANLKNGRLVAALEVIDRS